MNAALAVGDWVRWMRAGSLVIGVVQYVSPRENYPWGTRIVTDAGGVEESEILEVRKAVAP